MEARGWDSRLLSYNAPSPPPHTPHTTCTHSLWPSHDPLFYLKIIKSTKIKNKNTAFWGPGGLERRSARGDARTRASHSLCSSHQLSWSCVPLGSCYINSLFILSVRLLVNSKLLISSSFWRGIKNYMWIFDCMKFGTSNPHVIQGSTVLCILEIEFYFCWINITWKILPQKI